MSLKPTSTSYALLGLLSVRPWSAYELAQQMTRGLVHCWQVAPSVVYHEPKRLVAMGYATVTRQPAGQRTRAVYQITPAGRDALRQWLATPPAAPQVQMEPMLRLLFADSGTPEELAATLRALREWADRLLEIGARQCADYLDTGGPFPGLARPYRPVRRVLRPALRHDRRMGAARRGRRRPVAGDHQARAQPAYPRAPASRRRPRPPPRTGRHRRSQPGTARAGPRRWRARPGRRLLRGGWPAATREAGVPAEPVLGQGPSGRITGPA